MSKIPALKRLRQKDSSFEANLGCVVRLVSQREREGERRGGRSERENFIQLDFLFHPCLSHISQCYCLGPKAATVPMFLCHRVHVTEIQLVYQKFIAFCFLLAFVLREALARFHETGCLLAP